MFRIFIFVQIFVFCKLNLIELIMSGIQQHIVTAVRSSMILFAEFLERGLCKLQDMGKTTQRGFVSVFTPICYRLLPLLLICKSYTAWQARVLAHNKFHSPK